MDASPDDDFPSFLYWEIAHMTVREYIDLVREMMRVRLTPDIPEYSAIIDTCADELEAVADAAEAHLAKLGADYDSARETIEVAFEQRTDSLTSMIEGCIWSWTLFAERDIQAALDKSARKQGKGDSEEELREREEQSARGKRAQAVRAGIFGEDGQGFYRLSYAERFQTLLALLHSGAGLSDDEEGLLDYREFFPDKLAEGLPRIYADYRHELDAHLRDRDDSHGLADHRVALRHSLARYTHVLREAPDRWSDESCARVNAGLQPLPDRCRQMKQRH